MALKEYKKSLEQITAGLAHEVKNPLSLVKANIDLLELLDEKKEHEKNYKIMRKEIERVNELLLDFIQFAKPKSNELDKINIYVCCEELCDIINQSYLKHSNSFISISIETSNKDLCVLCDKEKMRRVFLNIIKNAVEALKDNNGKIIIAIEEIKNFVQIKIIDNGVGLDKETISKISSPYYTTKSGGSGLGLFISQTIIREHGGYFEIKGEENVGCEVIIMLPIY